IVALEHALDALADDDRREQLGERRGDRLEQRALTYEAHIGLDRKPRPRKNAAGRDDVVARKPEPVGELEPARNAAVALLRAVMVDQAAAPFAPHRRVLAARDQARVLDRDHCLVIVTVERPRLDLPLGALAAVQHAVEGMQPMIPARADVAQSRLELVGGQQGHSTTSMPSSAISHPAASTCARSAEPATRIGLVLLMWM